MNLSGSWAAAEAKSNHSTFNERHASSSELSTLIQPFQSFFQSF
jgi:hypothetical protein